MYLRDRADSEGKCWPGIKTIASDMSLSRSTVKRALTDLEQHGYLQKIPRYCFVEPIWEGALNFFLALCVVDGMVSAMMRRLENDPTPEESVSDTSNLHTDL